MTLSAFSKQINVFTSSLKGEAHKLVQREAARVVREVRAASPVPPAYRVNIGGKTGVVYDSVLPQLTLQAQEGVVLYFDHRREIAAEVMQRLIQNSPRDEGDYIASFSLFVNGSEAVSLADGLKKIIPGARAEVINTAPYARKLEVGKQADGTPFVVKVDPGIFERSISRLTKTRFKSIADVYWTFRDIENPYILRGAELGSTYVNSYGQRTKRFNRRDRQAGEAVQYPAVIIGERRRGGI